MTIIVTYASYPIAMQVSDRRLTWPDGSIADDDATKSILWNDAWIISFTGLARVDGKPTHLWLSELLANNHKDLSTGYLDRKIALLGKIIGNRIWAQPIARRNKKLAIIGVGWGMPWDVGEPSPEGLRIYAWHLSNFLDKNGDATDHVRRSFDFGTFQGRPLRKTEMGILSHGKEMEPYEWSRLCRLSRRARIKTTGPLPTARLLIDSVQRMRSSLVSKTVLVSSLPLPRLKRESLTLNRLPNLEVPSFCYVGPNNEWRLQHGPAIVSGGSITEAIEIRYGEALAWPR